MNRSILFSVLISSTLVLGCNKNVSEGCIDESLQHNNGCYTIYEPVCGCDGVTYGNDCEAGREGVTSYTNGKCK